MPLESMSFSSPPITEADLGRVETRLGISLPVPYRRFLLQHNGGRPNPAAFRFAPGAYGDSAVNMFFPINPDEYYDLLNQAEVYRNRVPSHILPIADDPGGNLVCIAASGPDAGKIYFWDHEREVEDGEVPAARNLSLVAPSFDRFVDALREDVA